MASSGLKQAPASRKYAQSYQSVFDSAVQTVHLLGWNLAQSSASQGLITASTPLNLLTFGDQVKVLVQRRHGRVQVDVTSTSPQLIDWGKGGQNVVQFFTILEQQLASVEPAANPGSDLGAAQLGGTAPLTPPEGTALTPSMDVPAGVDFGRYHALIIGINDYRSLPRLKTAVSDARAVAQVLEQRYGFQTRTLENASRGEILMALTAYRNRLTQRDNLLIYYAGHGWLDQEGDQGYWLPVDATESDTVNWISNASLTTALKAIKAKHAMVVADSCFSGKLTRGLKVRIQTPGYLERIARKRARVVLASGGLEPVADAGGKMGHSVFASAFLEALRDNAGVMDGMSLFSRVRRPVMVNTDQTPEYADIRKAGHDGGDFLFVARP
ncbi:putative peptidase C14 caspase catalytic subunit p20 [Magnetofaba australis IT-1]|uniref:Putative peptidase C14 caspase catalytic subunit p20 n=1 Tax=Magnetofaba australis IT-1 TaxID=1434232 RepID=A0A1Y2K4N2_9PROT|nr:putative peptidase C14 caspase catalytic subunit p20 [Magnetofaba australis IT-1]